MRQSFHFYLLNAAMYSRAPQQAQLKPKSGAHFNSAIMKLVLIEISGLLALLIAPLLISIKPKKKAVVVIKKTMVELSEYAVNEYGVLELLHPAKNIAP